MLFLQPNSFFTHFQNSFLGILFIGSYAFNWTWTGFKENGTLWDWLGLLLVPLIVAALPIWYSIHQNRSNSESIQHEIG